MTYLGNSNIILFIALDLILINIYIMAKETKKAKKVEKSDEIVLNLDSFMVPLAIVLAGVIVAGAIFFTNKGTGTNDLSNPSNDNAAAPTQEEFPEASTTIADAPYLGDKKKAKLAIVEYNDYQCSYCQRHDKETKDQLIKDYVDTGKAIYVFREFPLDFHGQLAIDSANAALCVNDIAGVDKFKEYHSKIYLITSKDTLTTVAQDMGINMDKFNKCLADEKFQANVDKGLADGTAAGVQGTPGFVVGILDEDGTVTGKLVAGAYPYDSFAKILDEYLK